jgi:short-subunit dehydrogenase
LLELDLVERSAPGRLLAEAVERLGGLDLLFSNAGVIWAAPFLSMTDDDIDKLVDVNFAMQARLTRHVLPFMAERGGGTIAYTGSLSSYVHSPLHSVYTGTKGGLNNFVRALRREIARERLNVRLGIIQPNITRTGLAATDLFDEISKRYTLQAPEQVADAFLGGLASGRDEIFVEVADHLWKWAERVASPAVGLAFRAGTSDELIEMAEAAVGDSKLRRQIAQTNSPE